jgi:DNA mismatch repair protein MutS
LAGVPSSVLGRAEEILFSLENGRSKQPLKISSPQSYPNQLALFDAKDIMHKEILSLDIDSMTPLEAMTELYKLKQIANQSAK